MAADNSKIIVTGSGIFVATAGPDMAHGGSCEYHSGAGVIFMRLTTALTFDAAHRMLRHASRCAERYSYTCHLEVRVGAEQFDRLGMVIDFDDQKVLVKKAVVDLLNHTTLSSQEPLAAAIAQVQAEAPEKVVRLSGLREALQAISQSVPSGITLERIAIRETPTCSAEISRDRA